MLMYPRWLAGCTLITACLLIGCPSPNEDNFSEFTMDAANDAPAEDNTDDVDPPPIDETDDPLVKDDHNPDSNQNAQHTNRLAKETSPYLLLHAHNPVDWYPWGDEAFAKAKEENKPIFLSIGYSSCYWCHVMERESFMDEEIAKFLNEHFVCVKVDREERPDVDQIYMKALQLTRQRGGWPLSMFLSPGGKPLFAQQYGMLGGTYWPARDGDREGHIGFFTVAKSVDEVWTKDRETLLEGADLVADAVKQTLRGQAEVEAVELDATMITGVMESLADDYDPKWGGFGYSAANPQMPKFPEPSNLLFLIDRIGRKDIEIVDEATEMLTGTLDKMAQGGIYDHLGGGFHRYSVDRFWHIPHFEKMLYDNGQLASVYAEAYKLTGNESYRQVVIGILDFVQREMLDEAGGFYSALDAETDAEEGKFYRWEKEELDELLTEDERKLFGKIYDLNGEPNFEEEYYVPMLAKSLAEHADERDMTLAELREKLQPTREKLFTVREKRKRPLTDTKILTSWNGLMIRGFADAGRLLDEPKYIEVAELAAQFVRDNIREKDGRLLHTYTDGQAKLNAYLDDYAFLTDGYIALHRATGDGKYLTVARELTDQQLELFWDDEAGGFFFTSSDHEELIARVKDPIDTVIPSGNSVSAGNLLYLAGATDDEALSKSYREKANETMQSSGLYLRASPNSVPRMVTQVAEHLAAEKSEGKQ